jgi:hypothetical protein
MITSFARNTKSMHLHVCSAPSRVAHRFVNKFFHMIQILVIAYHRNFSDHSSDDHSYMEIYAACLSAERHGRSQSFHLTQRLCPVVVCKFGLR